MAEWLRVFISLTQSFMFEPHRGTCDTSQVLIADMPGVFSVYSRFFSSPTDWTIIWLKSGPFLAFWSDEIGKNDFGEKKCSC